MRPPSRLPKTDPRGAPAAIYDRISHKFLALPDSELTLTVRAKGIVFSFARRKRHTKDADCCWHICSATLMYTLVMLDLTLIILGNPYNTLQTPKQVESNFISKKRIDNQCRSRKCTTQDKYQSFAIDIGDATPKQQETAECQGISGHNPLESTFRDSEVISNGGQDDNDSLHGKSLHSIVRQSDTRK
jgi:hypothetical protein